MLKVATFLWLEYEEHLEFVNREWQQVRKWISHLRDLSSFCSFEDEWCHIFSPTLWMSTHTHAHTARSTLWKCHSINQFLLNQPKIFTIWTWFCTAKAKHVDRIGKPAFIASLIFCAHKRILYKLNIDTLVLNMSSYLEMLWVLFFWEIRILLKICTCHDLEALGNTNSSDHLFARVAKVTEQNEDAECRMIHKSLAVNNTTLADKQNQ